MSFIDTRRDGRVYYVTINRPQVANALHAGAFAELSEAFDEFETDDDLWVAVLTGAGEKAFCAGRDLKQLHYISNDATAEERAAEVDLWRRTKRLTDRFDMVKPIIARVNGLALGGGLELALACDIIVAADHAQLGLPEPRRGLIAIAGGVHRLPRQIGLKAAMGYLLTGRSMSAARAYELGLVNEIAPLGDLDVAVSSWVEDILKCAPLAVRATKQCVMQGLESPLELAMRDRYACEELRASSADAVEGPRAFAEKRHPRWIGR